MGGQSPEPKQTFTQDNAVTVTMYNMGQDCQSLRATGLRNPNLRIQKQEVDSGDSRAGGWPGPGGQRQVPGIQSQSHVKSAEIMKL